TRRHAVDDCLIQLVDHLYARHIRYRKRIQPRFAVAINHDTARHRANIRALTADYDCAEVLVRFGPARLRPIVCPTIIGGLLASSLLPGAPKVMSWAHARLFPAAHLADPPLQFVGIEMAITRIAKRGTRTTLECKQGSVSTFRRAAAVPAAGNGAN